MDYKNLYRWFSTESVRTPGDFSWSRLQSGKDFTACMSGVELIALIKSTPNTTDLINLSGINLGECDSELFSDLLSAINPNITILDLSFNHLHLLNSTQFNAAFCLLPSSIATLILNNNKLHLLSFEEFKQILSALPSTLKNLYLLNNGLEKYPQEDLMTFLDSLEMTIHLHEPSDLLDEPHGSAASCK